MSRFIEGANRYQSTLFPESLDEYVGEDNAVRVVDVFVDELDLSGLGSQTELSDTGRPGYHPAMKGATMLATLHQLGVVASFSRPRVSDDNPFSETLFRTLKYRPDYPEQPFAGLGAARAWVGRFVDWYNNEHRHSALRFVTPAQRHAGHDCALLAARHEVYQDARENHPERWSRRTRNWEPAGAVRLPTFRPKTRVEDNAQHQAAA